MNSDNLSRFHIPHLRVVLEEIFGIAPWGVQPATIRELALHTGQQEVTVTKKLEDIAAHGLGVEISCLELHQLLGKGASGPPVLLVDVREPWEFDTCHIKGSLLLHATDPDFIKDAIGKAAMTVMICHHGVRSYSAAMYFRSLGFPEVKSLAGGVEQWASEIEPAMARY